jgi:hypothetical protein
LWIVVIQIDYLNSRLYAPPSPKSLSGSNSGTNY